MADPQYSAKFNEMQKYLPFLQKVIDKLRINNDQQGDNPRQGQLKKMEMLHDLLTDKGKRLKMDTLLKCEGVLIKLHTKMEKSPFLQSDNDTSNMTSTSNTQQEQKQMIVPNSPVEIVDITGPASPPPQPIEEAQPVEIPTERRCSPFEPTKHTKNSKWDKGTNERPRHKQQQQQYQAHSKNQQEKPIPERNRSFERTDNRTTNDKSRNRSRNRWDESWKKTATPTNTHQNTSVSSCSSNGSYQHHRNLSNFRNSDGNCNSPPNNNSKQHLNRWNQQRNCEFQADRKDVYSPKESWDELTNKPPAKTPVVTIIDLLDNSQSPTNETEVMKAFNETIFNYKKPETSVDRNKKVFARLGEKVSDVETSSSPINNFENFKVKLSNERAATLPRSHTVFSSSPKKPAPISIPVKVPTIPEVLKSPPLSASDISNLLYESMDISPQASPNISDVGTRRPPKKTEPTTSNLLSSTATTTLGAPTPPPSLDMVRKKLAMISKNSPQFRESPASPISPVSIYSPVHVPPQNISNERLALKYNPHRRSESISSNECGGSSPGVTLMPPSDPRLNKQVSPLPSFNVLPSINLKDPRLRRGSSILPMNLVPPQPVPAPTQLQQTPFIPQIPKTHFSGSGGPPIFKPRIDPRYIRGTSRPPDFSTGSYNDPRMSRRSSITRRSPSQDRSRSSTHGCQNVNNNNKYQQSTSGTSGPSKNAHQTKIARSQNPKATTDCSSEENWDSEPETSGPAKVPVVNIPVKAAIPQSNLKTSGPAKAPVLNIPVKAAIPETNLKNTSKLTVTPKITAAPKQTPAPKTTSASKSTAASKPSETYSSEENWDSDPETSTAPKWNSLTEHTQQHTNNSMSSSTSKSTQNHNSAENWDVTTKLPTSSKTDKLPANVMIPNIEHSSTLKHLDSGTKKPFPWAIKPPWLPAEPKTNNAQISPRSTQQQALIISNIAIASPSNTAAIPMLSTYSAHTSSNPTKNASKTNKSTIQHRETAVDGDNRVPSPEENWDTESHSSVSKSTATLNISRSESGAPNSARNNESPVPNSTRFSALLNDKSERIKYFESKKQKFAPPRTYGEFKKAKARAAAEEAAKKAAQDAGKKPLPISDSKTTEATPKLVDNTEIPAGISTKTAPVSTLDILYRNSNFSSCEFPKTKTSFKIPKKQTASGSKEDETGEIKEKELNKLASVDKQEESTKEKAKLDKVDSKKNPKEKLSKDLKAKVGQKVEHKKKLPESVEENDKTNKSKDNKTVLPNSSKKNVHNKETVTIHEEAKNTAEKIRTILNAKKGEKIVEKDPEQKNPKINTDLSKTIGKNQSQYQGKKFNTQKSDAEKSKPDEVEWLIIDEVGADADDLSDQKTMTSKSKCQVADEIAKTSSETTAVPNSTQAPSTPKTLTTTTNIVHTKTTPKDDNLKAINEEVPTFQPRRILKRRCTMIAYASAPEVDKEKLNSANAMLFEDLQQQQKKLKQKAEEDAKQLARKNKNLADIFQKTDDNCTVSTQNIITGKRRTRTTVNLNEVAFSQSVFKHIKVATTKKDIAISKPEAATESPKSLNAIKKIKNISPATKAGSKSTSATALKKGATAATRAAIVAAAVAKQNDVESVEEKYCKSLMEKEPSEDKNCATSSTSRSGVDSELTTPKLKKSTVSQSKSTTAAANITTEHNVNNESSSFANTTNNSVSDDNENTDVDVEDIINEVMHAIMYEPEKREYYLGKLRQIFSEDKIMRIEAYAKGKQRLAENVDDEDEKKSAKDSHDQNRKDEKSATKTRKTPKENIRKRKTRCNELDRLNADIRDMFICHGVLTANGRRVCTLVAEDKMSDNKTSTANQIEVDKAEKKTSPIAEALELVTNTVKTTPPPPLPRMRKAKVVISPLPKRHLRRSTRAKTALNTSESNQEESEEDEESVLNDNKMCTTTDVTEIENVTSLEEEATDSPPRRRMPVLKPNTPIKLPEEDVANKPDEADELLLKPPLAKRRKVEVKLVKLNVKPCPKSKKDVIPVDIDDSSTSLETEHDDQNDSKLTETNENQENKADIPNTNLNWHSQSKYAKWCFLCKINLHFPAMHYKMHHPEHYASRLAPTILQQFKQGKLSKPLFGTWAKKIRFWFYRCPFCLQHKRCPVKSWLEHFVSHTGEYNYECSKCHKGNNKPSIIEKHIKKVCSGAEVVRNNFFCWSLTQSIIKAHVCHLCNFIQLERKNLERHYVHQHGCNAATVDVLGYSITLINTEKVDIVSQKKATHLEEAAIKKVSNHELVIDDDEDVDEDNEEQKQTATMKEQKPSKNTDEISEAKTAVEKNEKNDTSEVPNEHDSTSDSEDDNITLAEKYKNPIKTYVKKKVIPLTKTVEHASQAGPDKILVLTAKDCVDSERSSGEEAQDIQNEILVLAAQAEVDALKEIPKSHQLPKAINSNVFMPTRETNDSPTTVIFAQSLLTIEQDSDMNVVVGGIDKRTKSNTSVVKKSISIAERLSQRFKGLTEKTNTVEPLEMHSIIPDATAVNIVAEHSSINTVNNLNDKADVEPLVSANTSVSSTFDNMVIAEENIDLDTSFEEDFKVPEKTGEDCLTTSDTAEEDDGNWEDIEITETAPSTCSSSSAISKDSKTNKRKKIFQKYNRLFKKSSSNEDAKKKRPINTNSETVNGTETVTEKSSDASNNIDIIAPLGFRPMITNLADLLPDSPCNDPIELVPELASLEPLQDLSDITSLLDSNFSALDTQNILQQMDLETTNSVCIDSDNHHTSIQEALDFVSEQEQLNINTEVIQSSQAIINRIQNVGYSVTLEEDDISFKFYCLSDCCTFLYSSEAIGLENHYISEHPQTRWTGYCSACKEQIFSTSSETNDYSLSQEIKHMLEKHAAPLTSPTTSINKTTEESTMTTTATTAVEEVEERPRIKIRRLTGDCLSSTTTTSSSTPSDLTIPNVMFNENTNLCDLLNAKPRPPTKEMPPQLEIPLTDPLFSNDATRAMTNGALPFEEITIEPLFKNVGSDLTIVSVASAEPIESMRAKMFTKTFTTSRQSPCELQISNVVSLGNAGQSDEISTNGKETTNNVINATTAKVTTSTTSTSSIQMPKISNVCSLGPRAGALWADQINTERVELKKSAIQAKELSRLLTIRSSPSPSRTTTSTSRADSPEPEVVSETVPIAQATAGDFLITQTVSAHYKEGNSSAQVGFNISIASTNLGASSNSNSGSASPVTVVAPSTPPPLAFSAVQKTANKPKSVNTTTTVSSTITNNTTMSRPFYKCMGNNCKYQTRVTVAMSDHLRFHERRNLSKNRDYFRCSLCDHLAEDVDDFIKHAEQKHMSGKAVTPTSAVETSSTNALTQKIQDILKSSAERRNSVSNETTVQSNASRTNTVSAVKPYRQQLEETIKDIVASTGVPDEKLYRCTIDGCRTPLTESTFHSHLVYHLSTLGIHANTTNYNYKCPHCTASYQRPTGIKAHIKCHARHRYFCYICMETASNAGQILKHFCDKHWRTMNMYTAHLLATPTTTDAEIDTPIYYVAYAQQISDAEVQQFGEKLIIESARRKANSKTHFKPSEMALLPIQPIFQREVCCADCQYKTKVRTNMLRHLQAHKAGVAGGASGAVDPINPVPCLNTNERHFDKMTNMAASSLPLTAGTTAAATKPVFKLPYAYVPESKRFTCGVANCQYLTISDDIFRSHLSALHSGVNSYSCPFCHEDICKRGLSADRIVQHLRYHGLRLFQCEECDYLHYMKNVVERHIHEKHSTLRVNLVTHVRMSKDGVTEIVSTNTTMITGKKFKEITPNDTVAADASATVASTKSTDAATETAANSTKSKHKWSCDLCTYRAMTLPQITQHCQTRHGCKHPYQCIHCPFGAQQLSQIMTHIDQKHDGRPREVHNIFHKLQQQNEAEDAADTRPLWQRDDPKRVRHIRGILMEDEEESEQYRKRLCQDIDDDDDENEEGNLVIALDDAATEQTHTSSAAATTTTIPQTYFLNVYEFGCLHCDYKANSFGAAQKHWHDEHNSSAATARPFFFRLLKRLKCSECLKFIGCYSELQLHLQNVHKTRVYAAADPETTRTGVNSCGYCGFHYARPEVLVKHHQREAHMPQDIKLFTASHFKSIIELGRSQTYLQCTLCAELFANRETIVEHARTKHEHDEGFSFKELSDNDAPIFRCAICQFTATTELATLRHMIDHYGQFKRCHFCHQPQTTFNGYMQHCYSDHRQEIRRFSEIYTFRDIKKYLTQMFVIFANGFVINKKNLRLIQPHGSETRINQLYAEICKTSQQPPIPRLSIARLVARKSCEAQQFSTPTTTTTSNYRSNSPRLLLSPFSNEDEHTELACSSTSTAAAMQLAGNNSRQSLQQRAAAAATSTTTTAKKICKRRSTVALGSHDSPFSLLKTTFGVPSKKPKTSTNLPPPPSPPVTISLFSEDSNSSLASCGSSPAHAQNLPTPYSFYGSRPQTPDLSKIYTKIAIGGLEATPLTIDKFKLLFPIDARVVLDTREIANYTSRQYSHVRKACPASQKHRFV